MAFYDDATKIIRDSFPSMGKANDIVGGAFPSFAAADRILAAAGMIPKRGRGGSKGAPTPGTAGGLGRRGALPPGTRTGPRYTGPRTPLGPAAKIIGEDLRAGGAVDINVWAGKLQAAGVSAEAIRAAYDGAGGDADLSAEQRAGNTSDFLEDFVEGLTSLGADPAVILGAYQQAGGLRG